MKQINKQTNKICYPGIKSGTFLTRFFLGENWLLQIMGIPSTTVSSCYGLNIGMRAVLLVQWLQPTLQWPSASLPLDDQIPAHPMMTKSQPTPQCPSPSPPLSDQVPAHPAMTKSQLTSPLNDQVPAHPPMTKSLSTPYNRAFITPWPWLPQSDKGRNRLLRNFLSSFMYCRGPGLPLLCLLSTALSCRLLLQRHDGCESWPRGVRWTSQVSATFPYILYWWVTDTFSVVCATTTVRSRQGCSVDHEFRPQTPVMCSGHSRLSPL